MVEVLTSTIASGLITEIIKFLQKDKSSKEDRAELRKRVTELVSLSSNTGYAIRCYSQLLKNSSEASVHCTELKRLLRVLPKKDGEAQLDTFGDLRFYRHLRKEAIERIHYYRNDYEYLRQIFDIAERHLNILKNDYKTDKPSYDQEMEHLNRQLDEIVIFASRRIEESVEALGEAYKVLEATNRYG